MNNQTKTLYKKLYIAFELDWTCQQDPEQEIGEEEAQECRAYACRLAEIALREIEGSRKIKGVGENVD